MVSRPCWRWPQSCTPPDVRFRCTTAPVLVHRRAFIPQLENAPFAGRVHLHFSDEQRLDLAAVLCDVPDNTHVYTCGPTRLMDAVTDQANAHGVPR
ncbi:hypothetical protein [Lelliottia nimipressuralis]|uniref:hypothetical protein n=1 Tax=Lelliottia nimipressuralis TaxID=69220 RepID=UPI003D2A9EED